MAAGGRRDGLHRHEPRRPEHSAVHRAGRNFSDKHQGNRVFGVDLLLGHERVHRFEIVPADFEDVGDVLDFLDIFGVLLQRRAVCNLRSAGDQGKVVRGNSGEFAK